MASVDLTNTTDPISPIADERPELELLQITLIVHDLASTIRAFEKTLGLRVAFRDPGVKLWGLENAVLPMGTTFIELLSPLREDTAGGRHLKRQSGDGGYMVILRTDALDPWRASLAARDVRIAWEGESTEYENARWAGLHLHPGDTGGMMISLDRPDPPESWVGAGLAWRDYVVQDVVKGLIGVTLRSPHLERLAMRWTEVLGRSSRGDEGRIDLDQGRIDFVACAAGEIEGLARVQLEASDRTRVGEEEVLRGVVFELV